MFYFENKIFNPVHIEIIQTFEFDKILEHFYENIAVRVFESSHLYSVVQIKW